MNNLDTLLQSWDSPLITDGDLIINLALKPSQRYGIVNRALKRGHLVRIRRGLYLVGRPYNQESTHPYLISQAIYGPSYVSFETALAYHGWIPEAVHQIRCATGRRAAEFSTPVGEFRYFHVPNEYLFQGAVRHPDGYIIANPWLAVADHLYVFKRPWKSLADVCLDLRIDQEDMLDSEIDVLEELSESYTSLRVRKLLKRCLKELCQSNS